MPTQRHQRRQAGSSIVWVMVLSALASTFFLTSMTRQRTSLRTLEAQIARDRAFLELERRVLFARTLLRAGDVPANLKFDRNLLRVNYETEMESRTGPAFRFSVSAAFDPDANFALVAFQFDPELTVDKRTLGRQGPLATFGDQPDTPAEVSFAPKAQPPSLTAIGRLPVLFGLVLFFGLFGGFYLIDRRMASDSPFR